MRTILLTTLLLLVAAPAALAKDPRLFEGCTVAEPTPGERRITCREFKATVTPQKPGFSEEALLELLLKTITSGAAADTIRAEKATVTVAGAKRRGFRYVALDRPRGRTIHAGTFAAVPAPGGRFRLVGCEEKNAQRCPAVLEELALAVPVSTTPFQPSADGDRSLAGRALTVPAKCSVPGPARIHCPGVVLSWAQLAASDPPGMEWLYEGLRNALAKNGPVKETRRACALEGVKTECRRLDAALPGGKRATVLVALAQVRGQRVFAQCNVSGTMEARPPSPCDQVLVLP